MSDDDKPTAPLFGLKVEAPTWSAAPSPPLTVEMFREAIRLNEERAAWHAANPLGSEANPWIISHHEMMQMIEDGLAEEYTDEKGRVSYRRLYPPFTR